MYIYKKSSIAFGLLKQLGLGTIILSEPSYLCHCLLATKCILINK